MFVGLIVMQKVRWIHEKVSICLQDPSKCKDRLTAVLFMRSPVSSFHVLPHLDQTQNWYLCVLLSCFCRVERKPLLASLSLRGNGERLQWDKVDPHSSTQDCESIALNILSWSRVWNGDTFDRVKSCLVFSSTSFSSLSFHLACSGLLVSLLLNI